MAPFDFGLEGAFSMPTRAILSDAGVEELRPTLTQAIDAIKQAGQS